MTSAFIIIKPQTIFRAHVREAGLSFRSLGEGVSRPCILFIYFNHKPFSLLTDQKLLPKINQ